MKQWEYKQVGQAYALREEQLNKLGADGWEFVAYFQYSHDTVAVFKREKSSIHLPN